LSFLADAAGDAGVQATVPMLRGVWGAALHDLDGEAYRTVFRRRRRGCEAPALYVLRPAPPDPAFAPAVEWISIGTALQFDRVLERAGMSLPERGWAPSAAGSTCGGVSAWPDGQPQENEARRAAAPALAPSFGAGL